MTTLRELMTRKLVTIEPGELVVEAARRITQDRVSHLLVVEDGDLVGVLCACDLEAAPGGAQVRHAMARNLFTIDVGATPAQTAEHMLESSVSCLPVLSRGRLCGVVTRSDLSRVGLLEAYVDRCSACGSNDHVRCDEHGQVAGFCLECRRRSEPPRWDDETGGGS